MNNKIKPKPIRGKINYYGEIHRFKQIPRTFAALVKKISMMYPKLRCDFVIAVIEKKEISSFLTTEEELEAKIGTLQNVKRKLLSLRVIHYEDVPVG